MLILVEGPPQSGKSTFATALAESLAEQASEVRHWYGFQDIGITTSEAYLTAMLDRLDDYSPADPDRHIVCDEWHLSHALYMPITHTSRPHIAPPHVIRYVETRLARLGAVVVSMDTPLDVVMERYARRSPFYANSPRMTPRIPQFHAAHADYRAHAGTDLLVLPSSQGVSQITEVAGYAQRQAAKLAGFPLYTGPSDPSALILEWSPGEYTTMRPSDNTAARHFLKCVEMDPELAASCGYINAGSVSADHLVSLREHLGNPRVVALGAKAYSAVSERMPDASMIVDPRSARRTWGMYGEAYMMLIRRAVTSDKPVITHRWTPMDEHEPASVSAR